MTNSIIDLSWKKVIKLSFPINLESAQLSSSASSDLRVWKPENCSALIEKLSFFCLSTNSFQTSASIFFTDIEITRMHAQPLILVYLNNIVQTTVRRRACLK